MDWLAKSFADERLDEVAADIRRLSLSRIVSGILAAGIVSFGLGLSGSLIWLSAFLIAEGVASVATRNFSKGRTGTPRDRTIFVLTALPVNGSWAALAAVLWLHGEVLLKLAAVAIWCGQLVFTQQYRHQPLALLITSAIAPVSCLIVFPFFFLQGEDPATNTARWSLVLLIGATLNVALRNRAAARRMDALTRGLREEREKALEAARAKSTFIAVTSHELRTPMNGLLGMAHALERSNLSPQQHQQVELMIKSGESLMQLLNDVLDLSRIETGKVELAPQDMDLKAVVGEVVDAWRDAAVFKTLTLSASYGPGLPPGVHADPLRIRQVLTNLVSNAIKFTAVGSVRVEVDATLDKSGQHRVSIAVADTGPGVPPEAAERVFDSFTQADQTISREHGGAGLGLSIARAMARQMGGDLVLEPAAVGARFVFTILASGCARPPTPARDQAAEGEKDLGQIHVLMAEDNTINQLVVRAMLEPVNVVLTIVANGEEAVKAMSEQRFNCVLMDINMPVMDGISALKAIREGKAGDPKTPVIALTASAMAGDRERFLGLGFDDYLGKPVKPADLITAIAKTVNPEPPNAGRRAA